MISHARKILFSLSLLMLLSPAARLSFAAEEGATENSEEGGENYIYKWTDKDGVVHFSDDEGAKGNSGVKKIEVEESDSADDPSSYRSPAPRSNSNVGDYYKKKRERKKEKAKAIKSAMLELAARQKEVGEAFRKKQEEAFYLGSVQKYIQAKEANAELEKIKILAEQIDEEIAHLKEAGRRNGVKPGWFRKNGFD